MVLLRFISSPSPPQPQRRDRERVGSRGYYPFFHYYHVAARLYDRPSALRCRARETGGPCWDATARAAAKSSSTRTADLAED